MTTTTAPAAQFSDAAVALWNLQNEATAARALATMGERVSAARFVARQKQADEATAKYAAAMNDADPDVMDEYAALLRWRHANGMR